MNEINLPEQSSEEIVAITLYILLVTTGKRILRRLCFYTCVSVILFTGEYLGRYPRAGTTPPPGHSACWDTVNKRAVRIPLECILFIIL